MSASSLELSFRDIIRSYYPDMSKNDIHALIASVDSSNTIPQSLILKIKNLFDELDTEFIALVNTYDILAVLLQSAKLREFVPNLDSLFPPKELQRLKLSKEQISLHQLIIKLFEQSHKVQLQEVCVLYNFMFLYVVRSAFDLLLKYFFYKMILALTNM